MRVSARQLNIVTRANQIGYFSEIIDAQGVQIFIKFQTCHVKEQHGRQSGAFYTKKKKIVLVIKMEKRQSKKPRLITSMSSKALNNANAYQ